MTQNSHPSSRRRPEEKKEAEDLFVEKILELIKWAKGNSQTLILLGFAALVLGVGGIYYASYKSSVTDQAVTQLEQVQAAVGFGEREEAKAQLYQYLERFDGTVYALEARLILGQLLLEDQNPEEAKTVLAPAVRAMGDQPIGVQAAFLMAAAYEESGEAEESERLLLRIANTSELLFQIQEAMAGAARLRLQSGDFQGAASLYEEVLADIDPGDPSRSYWEMRLAEAKARS
jgi:predicted negative regulator of RcsB-dependent stress response